MCLGPVFATIDYTSASEQRSMAYSQFNRQLVERARRGERQACEELLNRLEPMFRAFFVKRVGMNASVDDLVQNTLLRVHGGLRALKDPDRLKPFAMKAALFELHDLYRGRYSAKEMLFEPEGLPELPGEWSDRAGIAVDLERALSVLTAHARKILEMREYGYRYKEIASALGTTETAVKMQVKRAFEKMRGVFAA